MWTHLIRFESTAADFASLVDDLALPIPRVLPHLKPSEQKMSHRATTLRRYTGRPSVRGALGLLRPPTQYQDFYSKHSRRLVETHFADDLEHFGYDF